MTKMFTAGLAAAALFAATLMTTGPSLAQGSNPTLHENPHYNGGHYGYYGRPYSGRFYDNRFGYRYWGRTDW